MSTLRDTGWAKLNLTLEVLGRRRDGFHEIRSLVAFAAFGDTVEFDPEQSLDFQLEGPFAPALRGDNLIVKAARTASGKVPGLRLGRFRLIKRLPVAAGLGGGSADAAAALRLIARANAGRTTMSQLAGLAPELGSDVRVCLESRPSIMTGRGEIVEPVKGFPTCGVLLANPRLPLATEAVYAALGAAPFADTPARKTEVPNFHSDFEALLEYALPRGNDLEVPAARLAPEIRDVLTNLSALSTVRLARLSGSGPTCFALFATEDQANDAALSLSRLRPDWWIVASSLGEPHHPN